MSKKSLPDSQDGNQRKPQEYMNDFLSDAESGSNVSHDQQNDGDGGDGGEHYIPSRDFAPQHRISASASYVPRNGEGGGGSNYAVQQVVPNTHIPMSRSNSGNNGSGGGGGGGSGHSTGYRNRAQSGVSSNYMNMRSVQSNSGSAQNVSQPEASADPRDNDIPLMVKPKTLYQNPQTPTVLPSTYHPINTWSTLKQTYLKEFLAEFMGTMVMIFFGCTVVCQVRSGQQQQRVTFLKELSASTQVPAENKIELLQYLMPVDQFGTYDDVALIWGGAVVMGYFAAGGSALSGGHLNPALTLSNCVFRGFPWRKVPVYWAGQLLGAYCGALIVFAYYMPVIKYVYPDWNGNETVLGMFCTSPLQYLDSSRQFISELICSAVLQVGIFALTDPYTCLRSDLFPLMLFVLIFCLIGATALQTGAGLNPARDLGPRLALATVGFESDTLWRAHHHYFWVPIVAPFVGTLLGGTVYDICIYQGHESPLNWPYSLVKHKARRAWSNRPRFYRKRAGSDSAVSDWEYDNESNNASARDTDNEDTPKTGFFPESDPQIQKHVQFKSMSKNFNGKRNPVSGIPTIFEEGDDDDVDDADEAASGNETEKRPPLKPKSSKSFDKKGKKQ
ncbi:Glycerol uptake/efflux facilitator protein [Lachancea thermotolerans]